jgi:hypothetical protein
MAWQVHATVFSPPSTPVLVMLAKQCSISDEALLGCYRLKPVTAGLNQQDPQRGLEKAREIHLKSAS